MCDLLFAGGDPKSVTATSAPKEKKEKRDSRDQREREREVRSQASTPEEEDFSWDFGSPDHDANEQHRHNASRPSFVNFAPLLPLLPSAVSTKTTTTQSVPVGGASELLLSPVESVADKTKPQLVPARPPPPPPVPPVPAAGKLADLSDRSVALAKVSAVANPQHHAPLR